MWGTVCPMFALSRSARSLTVLILVSWLAVGCSFFKGDERAPGASAADEVGRPLVDMDLPVSLRRGDPQPTDAHQLEATSEQLRLGGVPIIPFGPNGRVNDTDKSNGIIPKLEAALKSPSHATLAVRMQANLPYETVALILNSAKSAGVMNASFAVREVGNSSKTGWLNADGYVMSSKADDMPPIPSVAPKTWESFTAKWATVTEACRTAQTGNCAYADANFARGGSLKIELFSSGRGINVDFYQRGLTPEQEKAEEQKRAKELAKKKEDFLQGRIAHDDMVKFLLLGDPSTQALFQFRYQEALSAPSSLTGTMAPLCHQERCGVLVAADEVSPMVRVVSMMGAAFPDGTAQPAFAFEMPWTKKIPANLPQWADDVLEKEAAKTP
jgi:hypothetical protein